MTDQVFGFDSDSIRRISRVVKAVEAAGLTGPAAPPPSRGPSIIPATILWGKVKTAYSPTQTDANVIILNPCDENGDDVDTDLDIPVYICMPKTSRPPEGTILAADMLVAYIPFVDSDDIEGVLVSMIEPIALFPVTVYKTGGGTGSPTTACTYKYTVKTVDEVTTLGTVMTPEKNRPSVGYMKAPSDGDIGLGYWSIAGVFYLFDANEIPEPTADGATRTFPVVTDVYISGTAVMQKKRTLTVVKGIVTNITDPEAISTVDAGTVCP